MIKPRPRRSSARRISGWNITGIAMANAVRLLAINQLSASRRSTAATEINPITSKAIPRKSATACVPRNMKVML